MDEFLDKFNDEEEQRKFGADMQKYTVYAVIPYILPVLFFLPYAIDKESDFCKFHSNQQLCWFIVFLILEVVGGILPVIGMLGSLLGIIFNLVSLLCMVVLVIGAAKGYAIKIPLLGDMIKPFN